MAEQVQRRARKSRKRRAPAEDAVTLRVADIEVRYGIGEGRLYDLFRVYEADAKAGKPHEDRRGLRSIRLLGRAGRKGTRLVYRSDLDAFLERSEVGRDG